MFLEYLPRISRGDRPFNIIASISLWCHAIQQNVIQHDDERFKLPPKCHDIQQNVIKQNVILHDNDWFKLHPKRHDIQQNDMQQSGVESYKDVSGKNYCHF